MRRRGAALPRDLDLGGALSPRVDWCASTLLNLVVQTSFRLTVAACRCGPPRCLWPHTISLLANGLHMRMQHMMRGRAHQAQASYRLVVFACPVRSPCSLWPLIISFSTLALNMPVHHMMRESALNSPHDEGIGIDQAPE